MKINVIILKHKLAINKYTNIYKYNLKINILICYSLIIILNIIQYANTSKIYLQKSYEDIDNVDC